MLEVRCWTCECESESSRPKPQWRRVSGLSTIMGTNVYYHLVSLVLEYLVKVDARTDHRMKFGEQCNTESQCRKARS